VARSIAKDHDEKRDAILQTATRFFAENGYDRASMTQLAKACGVSKALIYHYYSSKEAILFALLQDHLGALLDAVENAPVRGADAGDDLRILVATLLDKYRGADHAHRLQLEAMGTLGDAQRRELAQVQRAIVDRFSKVIRQIEPTYFRKREQDLYPVTMSLFGMLNWYYQWHRPGKGIGRAQYGELVTDLLLGGLAQLVKADSVQGVSAA
jgi:AcrR family transcriptional regulator